MNTKFDELTKAMAQSTTRRAAVKTGFAYLKRAMFLVVLSVMAYQPASAPAQGTAFTFHGQLTDNGTPANGTYDLEFRLFDQITGGTQQGGVNAFEDLDINNGLFTTKLDFGSDVFDGGARWLEIAVRPGASTGPFTTLVPRQQIT